MKNGILIIDDEDIYRSAAKRLIDKKWPGRQVFNAQNGEEGLEILLKNRSQIGFVLLDWQMPVMDGRTFLQNLSERPFGFDPQEISIVVSSGSLLLEDELRQFHSYCPYFNFHLLPKGSPSFASALHHLLS